MASFNININSKPVVDFNTYNRSESASSCSPYTNSFPIGFIYDLGGTFPFYFMIKNYNFSNPISSISITPTIYTNVNEFYLEYNGATIPLNTPQVINISALANNDPIPLLTYEALNADLSTGNKTIAFQMTVTDNQGNVSPVKNLYIFLQSSGCQQPVNALSVNTTTNDGCSTEGTISVKCPTGQTRYVQLTREGSHGTTFITDPVLNVAETITQDTVYTFAIEGVRNTQSTLNTVTSSVVATVRTSATGNILDGETITRNHTANLC